jgi:hypothetical protein
MYDIDLLVAAILTLAMRDETTELRDVLDRFDVILRELSERRLQAYRG